MKSRLPNISEYKSERVLLEAEWFNRILLSLRRLGVPQWERLGLRGVEFRIDRTLWLCSDLHLGNAPLVAWTDFEPRRDGLHLPVACRRILYTAYASPIAGRVLEELNRRIALRLSDMARPTAAQILRFPARGR